MKLLNRNDKSKEEKQKRDKRTSLSFSASELTDLARIIGAGKVMLQTSYPVVSRVKAAMTKMGVSTKGL